MPLFYFHGIPGSRLDFHQPVNQKALDGLAVRLIGIDRPGFGGSKLQPGQRYSDWPSYVAGVADHLGIERFGVIGFSAGDRTPSRASALPARVTVVAIVSGVGPAEMPRFHHGMGRTDSVMTRLSRWAPPPARMAIARAVKQATQSPDEFSRQFDKELATPDLPVHRDAEMRKAIREALVEPTKSGPQGVIEGYRAWASPSGLSYSNVAAPVRIGHGEGDAIVPMHHARYVARSGR